jgi:UDP-N-acetylmuramyl tripeptide synthase
VTPAPAVPTGIAIVDSRRLTGPNLLQNRPGPVIDAVCPDGRRVDLAAAWREEARLLLAAVGWKGEELSERHFRGGVSLAFSAPVDALYAATEVNEMAFRSAAARLIGAYPPDREATAERLIQAIGDERNPALMALREEAIRRGVAFLSDDEHVSVGLGSGSVTWPVSELPAPAAVDWAAVHDVPVALVTGTNGKTTTVRLLASIARTAGRVAGMTCTDGIEVGGETIDSGDYSGPGGARTVVRDRRVEMAILETARGGMLRRGLAVTRADAALVTNVGEDHLGEWGVEDLSALADTKMIVRKAVAERGVLVLNADDATLLERGLTLGQPLAWYSAGPAADHVRRHVTEGGSGALLDADRLVLASGRSNLTTILAVGDLPIALGGAARHNVSNALAAATVASALGMSEGTIAAGLSGFTGDSLRNPGRGNRFDLGGVTVVVDFAHNPHGFRALFEMARALPSERLLVLLGQAGDRDDESIRSLVAETWKARPDRIVIKEMTEYLRGRPEGEVAALIDAELRRLGAGDDQIERAASEIDGARSALRWARKGDLLLLLSHSSRTVMLKLMARLKDRGWQPGEKLP